MKSTFKSPSHTHPSPISSFDHQRPGCEAQMTPTSHSSGFDHQGSGLESPAADSNKSTNNLANQPQHPPSIIEFNKLKSDLEEQHKIDSEYMKTELNYAA